MTPDYEDPPEMVLTTMPHRQIVRPRDVCWRRVSIMPQQDLVRRIAIYCASCRRTELAPLVHLDCLAVRMDPDCEYYYWLGQCPRCHTGYWAWREKDC